MSENSRLLPTNSILNLPTDVIWVTTPNVVIAQTSYDRAGCNFLGLYGSREWPVYQKENRIFVLVPQTPADIDQIKLERENPAASSFLHLRRAP